MNEKIALPEGDVRRLAADIVAAFVSHNRLPVEDLPTVIHSVFSTLRDQYQEIDMVAATPEPAVAIRKSVSRNHIICLEDGKKFKSLKRHLRTAHNMTPEQYRARWSLRSDYPLVAPNYAAQRSELAKSIGLGRKVDEKATKKPARKARGTRQRLKRVA